MNDFGKFVFAARYLHEGANPYSVSPATLIPVSADESRQFLDLNPPHFHVLMIPFALCDPLVALVLWTVLSLACLVQSARIVNRELEPLQIQPTGRAWLALAALAFVGTGTQLVTGQLVWALMLPLTCAWRDIRRERWSRAAIPVAFAVSIKPFLAPLFAVFLLRRKYRAIAVGLGVYLACFAIACFLLGLDAHISWLKALGSVDWEWAGMNGSLAGIVNRSLSATPAFTELARRPDLIPLLLLGGTVLISSATAWVLLKGRPTNDHAFLLVVVASLLVSPLGWVYYSWILLPPLLALSQTGLVRKHPYTLAPVFVAAFWPPAACLLGQPSSLATLTAGSVYFWGFLFLWAAVARDSWEGSTDSDASPATANHQDAEDQRRRDQQVGLPVGSEQALNLVT